MVAYKETAEEQLLRMIEGPQTGSPSSAGGEPSEPPSRPEKWGGIGALAAGWIQRLSPSRIRPRGRDPLIWNLQLASRVLWVILAVLGAYVVVDLVLIQPTYQLSRTEGPGAAAGPVEARAPLKPLADYIGVVVQRDPFTGLLPGMAQQAPPPTTEKRLEQLVAGFALVGIDRGPRPAALIENTAEGRTLIVNVGDELNGMKVKQIDAEGVLLTYQGEEYLLR
ncbi:MAG: hypothetical protein HYZ94_02560 [Candidatus Omnitrophica bacterium]|nr:hypothetical protein [Candidatus Omnitrophota bacterium]